MSMPDANATPNPHPLLQEEAARLGLELTAAAIHRDWSTVEKLISAGADTNTIGNYGQSALLAAADAGREDMVQLLVVHGADIHFSCFWHGTALKQAAWHHHTDIMRLLLRYGADANQGDGDKPLTIAVQVDDVEEVRLLLENGAEVNSEISTDGCTALWHAAGTGSVPIMRLLLEHGADVNAGPTLISSPLMHAALYGHLGAVRFLLLHGADRLCCDAEGKTALDYAADEYTYAYLQNPCPDKLPENPVPELNPLTEEKAVEYMHNVFDAFDHDDEEGAIYWLLKGSDTRVRDEENRTVMHWAAIKGWNSVVSLALKYDVEVDGREEEGWTPLMAAAEYGYYGVCCMLLENGADVRATNKAGLTALMIAAYHGQLCVVRLLSRHGADINAQTPTGHTALIEAAMGEQPYVVRWLYRNGACMNARTNEGATALMLAAQLGYKGTVHFMLMNGANPFLRDDSGRTAYDYASNDAIRELLKYFEDLPAHAGYRDKLSFP